MLLKLMIVDMTDERMKLLMEVKGDPNYGKAVAIINGLDYYAVDNDSYSYGLPTGTNPDYDLDMVLIILSILNKK